MTAAKQFLNDVVKPWEVLNLSLSQNYAIDPKVSDFVRDARQLAIAIKHSPEIVGLSPDDRRAMLAESLPYAIMDDVADAAKHDEARLRNANRRNTLSLSALYEFNAQAQFRFIRNAIEIKHSTHGDRDFMHVAHDAIAYCMGRLALGRWTGTVRESGPAEFSDKVRLRFDPRLGVGMNAFELRFFKRGDNGELVPADTAFEFEVMDLTPTLRR